MMLGNIVRVNVTKPYDYFDNDENIRYKLNYGYAEVRSNGHYFEYPAFILGISHPVSSFEGRALCIVKHRDRRKNYLVVAPKKLNYINFQIEDALKFYNDTDVVRYECLYECSCGAVVYVHQNDTFKYLLIKNRRSSHWGFPKGHMERGETLYETAQREVLEETGLKIEIIDGFNSSSQYKICNRIEKSVTIFLGKADSTQTHIQVEEIDDSIWVPYDIAIKCLLFENDKKILRKANEFLTTTKRKV